MAQRAQYVVERPLKFRHLNDLIEDSFRNFGGGLYELHGLSEEPYRSFKLVRKREGREFTVLHPREMDEDNSRLIALGYEVKTAVLEAYPQTLIPPILGVWMPQFSVYVSSDSISCASINVNASSKKYLRFVERKISENDEINLLKRV